MPPRSTSRREASSAAWPATASSTIRILSAAFATGAELRCGGVAFGISHTWSRSATARSWPAAARWPLCTGSKVPPRMPITPSCVGLAAPPSALRIVEKLHIGNPHRFPTLGAVARQRLVQSPAVEHALEMGQAFGIGHVGHRQQPLELLPGDGKAAVDGLDGEGLRGAGAAIYLERRQRLRRHLTFAPLECAPRRPEQVLDAVAGRRRDGKGAPPKFHQPLAEGEHLGGVAHRVHLVEGYQVRAARQRRAVLLEFATHLLIVLPELLLVAGGGV